MTDTLILTDTLTVTDTGDLLGFGAVGEPAPNAALLANDKNRRSMIDGVIAALLLLPREIRLLVGVHDHVERCRRAV